MVRSFGTALMAVVAAGCMAEVISPDHEEGSEGGRGDGGDLADVGDPEPLVPGDDSNARANATITVGSIAHVCAKDAYQRKTNSAFAEKVATLPMGSSVKILKIDGGWYQNEWAFSVGWTAGQFLCAGDVPGPPLGHVGLYSTEVSRDAFVSIAHASVGFSYFWGGARLAAEAERGTCSGSCPSCTHTGDYGADCSGFAAKVWLLPDALPMNEDKHPYSTGSFASSSALWASVGRRDLKTGDLLNYNDGTRGHVVVYQQDDPFGSFWAYEARSCEYGIVHNIRTVGPAYKGVRRSGV